MIENTTASGINQERARYELALIQLSNMLASANEADRDRIQSEIDDLKDKYFRRRQKHDRDSYIPPSATPKRPPRAFQTTKAKKRALAPTEWKLLYPPILPSREAYSDASLVAQQAHRHPFKTRDRKDDMRYQTHGTKNPRAKR